MRWFKRERNGDADDLTPDSEPQNITPAPSDKTPSADDLTDTNVSLDSDTQATKKVTESIDGLNVKLASVKKEYELAIGNLFDVKTALASKRSETAAANATCDELQRRVNVLDAQLKRSEAQHAELHTNIHDRDKAAAEIIRIHSELDEGQKKLESVRKQITSANLELDSVHQKTKTSKAKLDESADLLQKSRTIIKKSNTTRHTPNNDVIRTASSMIGSLNDRIHAAEKEIGVLRDVLDKERREHAKTMAKIAKLKDPDSRT